ncbi:MULTISPECIES: TlpA disulfide reductase family protein [unclassified Wenzhouxiangella]|uniref:TlpA disulfide reductase family protein n=1 Tax=unclassified Wenzhouxiangella TaxID=2613841 RepID=UPI000E32BBC7|nr:MULTISPECIES: TlpA disulfide reductase family protein [unclassified Wenzhouxiangella]RFF27715.1 TlpA family protein disulfide reductase [Wenzhouxiangella sp. 15181]RFP69806.1 TlpA family protein disulfide reductase [Wenzhouxiangella sp. 15190]
MATLDIGPLALPMSRALILAAGIVALLVGAVLGQNKQESVTDSVFFVLFAGILSARAAFVLSYWEQYRSDLIGIIDIRDGGFDPIIGLIGALVLLGWQLWHQPAIRRALSGAAAAGLLTWFAGALLTGLIQPPAPTIPDTALTRLDTRMTTLPQLADGKPTVVNLWASWCPPCVREMPVLEKAQQENPDITFVFVNQGEQPETIQRFLARHGLSLGNVVTDTGASIGRSTGNRALPTTLFYNSQGKQVNTHLGELSAASLTHNLERFN